MTVSWHQPTLATLESFSDREIEERGIELWEGEVVENMTPAERFHAEYSMRLANLFGEYCARRPGLWRTGDNAGFVVRRNPDSFLSPDAALFRLRPQQRIAWHDFAPEVAVEIASPSNTRAQLLEKRDLYFRGGTEQFWLLDPPARTLEIHFPDGRVVKSCGGALEYEGIVQGLTVDIDWLLAPAPFE